MYKYIIVFLLSFPAYADNWYFSGGLAVHDSGLDGPEIQLDTVLGTLELGYEKPINPNVEVQYYIEHTSGIATKEDGLGFNKLGFKIKSNF